MRKAHQIDFLALAEQAEAIYRAAEHSDPWIKAYYLAAAHPVRSDEWFACCRRIYKLGEGLFIVAHRRWADSMEPSEVMGFMWEGLLLAVEGFKPELGVPLRAYWLSKVRSVLQNHYRTDGQGLVKVSTRDYKAGLRTSVSHHTDEEMEAIYASR